ncbi:MULTISPECIES: hypothetical protein [unclassified Pseudoxanthomonas]|uniref:hypothetical protein n=1 Tax=unclassified Pseudoxanthomonas TaxID=2645906 RepID=UPI00030787EE|nr:MULTISPECIES: hypothetical protein [unclassified Pseudoxanthomonas]
MTPEMKIRRHGYRLMSLASLGTVVSVTLGMGSALWLLSGHGSLFGAWVVFGLPWDEASRLPPGDRGLLAVSILVATAAYVVPLAAVRRLGKALYACDALSPAVATAFMRLAHSLPLSAALVVAAGVIAAVVRSQQGDWVLHITVDTNPYYFLLACLCLYSVAHLLRLAVRAAEDARSIV